MKTSCISHPANERLVIIRKWQVEFCEGNQCAAALLSFFEYWHSWKLNADRYNRKSNDIAEMHREPRLLTEDVYQYHSLNELSNGILYLYGEKSISKAIKLLESKLVITVHANPNPKFHYDKTQYFKFYPDICNEWIKSSYNSSTNHFDDNEKQNGQIDTAIMRDRDSVNTSGQGKNALYRTEINNKEINKLNEPCEDFIISDKQVEASENDINQVNAMVSILIQKGMPAERLIANPDLPMLAELITQGATQTIVTQAYELSVRATAGRSKQFGLRYLVKVIADLLKKSGKSEIIDRPSHQCSMQSFENNFSGGLDWMGDLVR